MGNRIEEKRIEEERRAYAANKKRKTAIIGGSVATAAILVFIVLNTVIIPASNYRKAENLLAVGEYNEAISILTELGDYKDSSELIRDANYNRVQNLIAQNSMQSLTEARETLLALSGYRDSDNILVECQFLLDSLCEREYRKACNIIEPSDSIATVGQINKAKEIFETLAVYKDAESKLAQCAEAIKWHGTWTYTSTSPAVTKTLYYVIIFDYIRESVYYAPAVFDMERRYFGVYPCVFSGNVATFTDYDNRIVQCNLSGGKMTAGSREYSYSSTIQYIQSSATNNQDTLREGEYWCMGKNDTCQNKTISAYQFYCRTCDPNGDNIEG